MRLSVEPLTIVEALTQVFHAAKIQAAPDISLPSGVRTEGSSVEQRRMLVSMKTCLALFVLGIASIGCGESSQVAPELGTSLASSSTEVDMLLSKSNSTSPTEKTSETDEGTTAIGASWISTRSK